MSFIPPANASPGYSTPRALVSTRDISHLFGPLFCILALFAWQSHAQQPNPSVVSVVKEVSTDSLRRNVERLVSFGTRHTLSDTTSDTRGIGAARRWIAREFSRYAAASDGRMEVRYHETVVPASARVPAPARVTNVIATIHPFDRHSGNASRILIVSAHYDSRASDIMDARSDAPGANDDGSGTALLLELARVLAPLRFDKTIVLAAFAGEEQGLLGASVLAKEARDGRWNVEAVLNNDIVGNSTGGNGVREDSSVRVFSMALAPSDSGGALRRMNALGLLEDGPSRSLARYVSLMAGRYVDGFDVRMIYRLDRYLRGGDHRPFHEQGFAAIRFSEAREHFDHQHQNVRSEGEREFGDLPQFMDLQYLANVTRINAAILTTLAWAPATPQKVSIDARSLGYETVLRWSPNAEHDLKGYRVLYRESSSATWQHHVDVTDTIATLQILKDDVLFGVQAVDKEENVSLPGIPGHEGR